MPRGKRRRPRGGKVDYRVTLGDRKFDPADTPPPRRGARGRSRRRVSGEGGAEDEARRGRPRDDDSERAHEGAPPPDPADTRLVQFTQPLAAEDIDRIRREYGLALTAYVPNLTYVERVDAETERRLQDESLVRAVAPYLPEYKVSSTIDHPPGLRPEGIEAGQLLLDAFLFDGGSIERVVATLEGVAAHDIRVMDDRPLGGNARVRFVLDDKGRVEEIAQLHDVRWIAPVARPKMDDADAAAMIQSGSSGTASLWDKGLHGEGQVIGMIDAGPVDIAHCFFADAAPNSFGAAHRKVLDIRNVSGGAPGDHATFVAGIAAGDERGNLGSNSHRGGAWAAKLVSGTTADLGASSLLAELTAAMGSGAFIHTNSWHDDTAGNGNPALYTQNSADVDNFTFNNENHLVLGSAGNNGEEQGPPGTAKNAICVSAAQASGDAMALGDGNPGPTADGRRKPDLVAVGCEIESAIVSTACDSREWAPGICATSWATPHAAAAAAIVRQYFAEGWYPSGAKVAANAFTPTGALLKAVLINSTVDMTGEPGFPSNTEGWGLVRLDRALFFSGGRRKLNVWDVRHATGPTTGETRTHQFTVDAETEQLKVALVWSDPPPAAGSFANPVVNNLDLGVLQPNGSTGYVGNDFQNGVSAPRSVTAPSTATLGDRLNPVEVVVVENPPPGRWTIVVRATNVAVGNPGQGYAVAATARLKSGCFVAASVYGDPDHADVEALRAWRDRNLQSRGAKRAAMAAFVDVYQVLGPRAARVVDQHPRLARALCAHVFPRIAAAVRRRS